LPSDPGWCKKNNLKPLSELSLQLPEMVRLAAELPTTRAAGGLDFTAIGGKNKGTAVP